MSLISSKDQEENLVAGEKNLFPQLLRPRDRATFGIPFVMEPGMPKPSFPLILIRKLLIMRGSYMEQLLDLTRGAHVRRTQERPGRKPFPQRDHAIQLVRTKIGS